MRKTKSMKFISVILAALLLVGALAVVSVMANEVGPRDRVEIVSKALDFETETKLVYGLRVNEELAEGESLYVLFWKKNPDEEGTKSAEELYKSALHRAVPYADGEGLFVSSLGIAASEITSDVYACPVIRAASGVGAETTYTYEIAGAVLAYSAADCAAEMAASADAKVKELGESVLAYGEMADKLFAGELNATEGEGDDENTDQPAPASSALSVSIAYKNISYKSALKIVYYVDAQNLSEGQSVKLLLWDEKPAEISLDGATVKSAAGKIGEYDAFLSDGIAPARMRDDVYAVAAVVDESGAIVKSSKILEYSVFDYCMDRIEKYPDEPKTGFYKALLDFGAAVQEYLMTEEEVASVGGWIDSYYAVKFDKKLDGELIAGAESSKVFLREEDLTSGVEVVADKAIVVNGKAVRFNGFTDGEGNAITAYPAAYTLKTWNKVTVKPEKNIGFVQCFYNYTSEGTIITYDDDSYKNLVSGMKDFTGTYVKDANGNNVLDENGKPIVESGIWGYVEDGVMKYGKWENTGELTLTYSNKDLEGSILVFETDIKFTAGTKALYNSKTDAWSFKLPHFKIGDTQYEMLLGYNVDDNGNGYFGAFHPDRFGALQNMYLDTWYNIRIEIDMTKETDNYTVYQNGCRIFTTTLKTAQWNGPLQTGKPLASINLNVRGYSHGVTLELDNTYVAME